VATGAGVGDGLFTTTAAVIPRAAAPPTRSAIVPAVRARPPAANPMGAMAAPVAAEKTVTSPGGPMAASFLSEGQSFASATTSVSFSGVRPSPNSVVVAWM